MMTIERLPETRRNILKTIKQNGPSAIAEMAAVLSMTEEGVRQHLGKLEHGGWIERVVERKRPGESGRPKLRYRLTSAGEQLFPKHYDMLAVEVLDTVSETLGSDALGRILVSLTESRVREWEPRLHGKSLREKVEELRSLYIADDPYASVDDTNGELRLIERNCPFFTIAMRRPALCSLSVSILMRLLGVRVVREERFQSGHGRCVFRVLAGEPVQIEEFYPEPMPGA